MNLELKHLAPYTPFRVKGISTITGTISTITGFNDRNSIVTYGDYTIGGFDSVKLLLYPLSTLSEEKWLDIFVKDDIDRILSVYLSDKHLGCIEYYLINILCQFHIDIFNLIENNLAIDITALQPLAK